MSVISSTAIVDLIARLEKATGPDRELDAAIWQVSGQIDSRKFGRWMGLQPRGSNLSIADYAMTFAPYFTGSIDAALTPAPGNDVHGVKCWMLDASVCPAIARVWSEKGMSEGRHKNPIVALCIAALRALAAVEERK